MADMKTLWQTRYRQEPAVALPDNPVLRTLMAHHSVRNYLPTPLPEGALEVGIAAASSAATSSNLQTWSVVVVEDEQKRARLAELSGGQKHIAVAPVFLAWVVDLSRLERIAQQRGLAAEALDFEETFLMATLDTGIAAQNAVVAFESMGLGTVYIGGLRNHPEDVAALLDLPPRSVAVVGLCVGQPDPAHQNGFKPRLGQDAVLHRERYNTADAEAISGYDARADAYQQEQGLPSRRWSVTVSERMETLRGLGGRHVIRSVLNRLGFPLK
nr:NADPH-dependent oxidoreductase [uncultured Neokomagataea sp.]